MPYSKILLTTFLLVAAASPGSAGTYTENFTTTVYKDTVNTTANWDTTGGELKLFPFVPTLIGTYNTSGRARDIAVSGDMALVADQTSGLQVIDISDPANPTLLGTYNTTGAALGVAVDGDYAFVADSGSGLIVIDISDPTNPALLGSYDTPGFASDVVISGNHAFVADYSGGLQVIDISNPALPTLAGTLTTPGNSNAIAVDGDYAFIADSNFGLRVVDITDPTTPVSIGFLDTPGSALGVAVDGDYAFITDQASLKVIDISDPTNPALLGSYNTSGVARDVVVAGDLAFVADGTSGLQVIDISDPTNPTLINSYNTTGEARGVAVAGNRAFVAGELSGLQVIEVSDPITPTLAGSYISTDVAYDVAVAGNLAFLAQGRVGLQIVSIADPGNPVLTGTFNTSETARGVAVAGNLAFVGDGGGGLLIIDVSDPTTPTLTGSYNTPGFFAEGVAVAGDLAFVADGGLLIIDVSDPTTPTLTGTYNTPGNANGVAVAGDLVFVTDGSSGLLIMDISDPTTPTLTGSYDTPGYAVGVVVAGDLLFVADGSSGLLIMDISDPTTPTLTGSYDTPDYARDVAVAGDLAFVADYDSGLVVIDISNPASPTLDRTYTTPSLVVPVAVAGEFAFLGTFGGPVLEVVQVSQHEVRASDNIGHSLALDEADDAIIRARLLSAETSGVSWELSADGGSSYQAFIPGAAWMELTIPGIDLLWRSTHTWSPGLNPTVLDLTIDWLNEFSSITSVADIPNDQGRQVRFTWGRSGHDFLGDPLQITEYAVYRAIDPALSSPQAPVTLTGLDALSSIGRAHAQMMQASGWDYLTTVPVLLEDSYSVVVPTLADSTISAGGYLTTFRVTALTATPGVFFHSPPDSGYSVDNIAPGVPSALAAMLNLGDVNLSWNEAPEEDFQYFRIYRDTDPGFDPGPGNLVHETAGTSWQDSPVDPGSVFYKITALDYAGNESDPASSGAVTAVGDGPGTPTVFALRPAVPNPLRAGTRIAFDLLKASQVSLEVFDVTGRLVRILTQESMPAGRHEIVWDATDNSGRKVAAGVYLYRLRAGRFKATRRLVVIR